MAKLTTTKIVYRDISTYRDKITAFGSIAADLRLDHGKDLKTMAEGYIADLPSNTNYAAIVIAHDPASPMFGNEQVLAYIVNNIDRMRKLASKVGVGCGISESDYIQPKQPPLKDRACGIVQSIIDGDIDFIMQDTGDDPQFVYPAELVEYTDSVMVGVNDITKRVLADLQSATEAPADEPSPIDVSKYSAIANYLESVYEKIKSVASTVTKHEELKPKRVAQAKAKAKNTKVKVPKITTSKTPVVAQESTVRLGAFVTGKYAIVRANGKTPYFIQAAGDRFEFVSAKRVGINGERSFRCTLTKAEEESLRSGKVSLGAFSANKLETNPRPIANTITFGETTLIDFCE